MRLSLPSMIGVFLAILASASPCAMAQTAETAPPDAQRTWLWVSAATPEPARHLSIVVSPEPAGITPELAAFRCDIRSDFGYRGARIHLSVLDGEHQVVSEGTLPLDIASGANTCRISLDTGVLPVGVYIARFTIEHVLVLSEPTHALTLRKVNADKLLEELETQSSAIGELAQSLDQMEQAGAPNPYLRLKANIVADTLVRARKNAGDGAWESLDQLLRYGHDRIESIRAGVVFGATRPEHSPAVAAPSLNNVTIHDGAFSVDGAPVYLFGGVLPDLDAEKLALLRRYQFNTATITLTSDGDRSPAATWNEKAARIRQFFDAAVDDNVGVAIQLAPDLLPAGLLASHPDLRMDGYIDIARPEVMADFEQVIAQLGPVLKGQPMLLGVSLANDPRFHFDGEQVKAGFLEFIRANYPDRLTLNRAWRSHLADLENITPWSANPYDTYQEHRPYQFDWQTYHQSLGNAYFDWSRRLVQTQLPGKPVMATLSNSVFSKGETRYGVNREQLAGLLQVSGCSGALSAEDRVYAMGYPAQSAYYCLLKSFQPDQPVFNLKCELEFAAGMEADEVYRYVHSAIWEGVMSGMSAATAPMDSLLFDRPEAIEAFATAALDVNRLAGIVHAFQMAPADVGILFSYASKVFDDGDPHLESASNAYEGVSFGGYNVRFISEAQCLTGALDSLKILVIPDTPALSDAAFLQISAFVEGGGTVARTGTPIPYNERGFSRGDLIRNTGNTVLVRGLNLPTEYLHAMDAATVLGALPQIPRPITGQGYPVEGLRSQYVEYAGGEYLYLINLRKEPVYCFLATQTYKGRDLIQGRDIEFPTTVEPLTPMLIRLEPAHLEMTVTAAANAGE